MKHPNTDRSIETYQEQIDIIRKAGFNPIAVCQMLHEDTFVFETCAEAHDAHNKLENCDDSLVVGWWYGLDEFEQVVFEYELENPDVYVNIFWLNRE